LSGDERPTPYSSLPAPLAAPTLLAWESSILNATYGGLREAR
jgi:hypothetical protein